MSKRLRTVLIVIAALAYWALLWAFALTNNVEA